MADNRQQTAKKSKGFRNRLKKAFGLGSQSTHQSRSNSPSNVVPSPVVGADPPVPSSPPVAEPPTPSPPALTAEARPIDPEEAAKLRAKYRHFRILVIGRANAGKTTLLKRVCNTTEDPCIYEEGKNLVSNRLIVRSRSHRFFTNSSNQPQRCRPMISAPLSDLMTDSNTIAGDPRCSSCIRLQEQSRVYLP